MSIHSKLVFRSKVLKPVLRSALRLHEEMFLYNQSDLLIEVPRCIVNGTLYRPIRNGDMYKAFLIDFIDDEVELPRSMKAITSTTEYPEVANSRQSTLNFSIGRTE